MREDREHGRVPQRSLHQRGLRQGRHSRLRRRGHQGDIRRVPHRLAIQGERPAAGRLRLAHRRREVHRPAHSQVEPAGGEEWRGLGQLARAGGGGERGGLLRARLQQRWVIE